MANQTNHLWPKTWLCGHCNEVVDHSHFYADGLGVSHHESDDHLRELLRQAAEEYQRENGRPRTDYEG